LWPNKFRGWLWQGKQAIPYYPPHRQITMDLTTAPVSEVSTEKNRKIPAKGGTGSQDLP